MSDLGKRCINCRVSAYSRLDEGIETDVGWLCGSCLKLPSNAVTATSKPED